MSSPLSYGGACPYTKRNRTGRLKKGGGEVIFAPFLKGNACACVRGRRKHRPKAGRESGLVLL